MHLKALPVAGYILHRIVSNKTPYLHHLVEVHGHSLSHAPVDILTCVPLPVTLALRHHLAREEPPQQDSLLDLGAARSRSGASNPPYYAA
jgi:hypothetical protein